MPSVHRPRTSFARAVVIVSFGFWTVFLSGCIYLRLLDLKRQLGDFDHNFTVSTANGVEITFLHPVLEVDDMGFFGIRAEKRERDKEFDVWKIRWTQIRPDKIRPAAPLSEMRIQAKFLEGRLKNLSVGEEFFALVPKPLFIATLRALGHASVKLSSKSAGTVYDPETRRSIGIIPTFSDIKMKLGEPFSKQVEQGATELEYRYISMPPRSENDAIRVRLKFDTRTEKMRTAEVSFSGGKLQLNME